jgi:hypothetical protein
VQAGLHRAEPLTGPIGNLSEAQVLVVAERDCDPLVGGQVRQSATEGVALGQGSGSVRGGRLRRLRDVDDPDASTTTEPVPATVDEDPVEPGVEPGAVPQRVEPLPRVHRRVLDRILCLQLAPEDHRREAIRPGQVKVGEHREGGRAFVVAHRAVSSLPLVDRDPRRFHVRPDERPPPKVHESRMRGLDADRGTPGPPAASWTR